MPSFSVTPVGPFNPATDEGFPQFIQFQDEGADLGGPDADTVNFTGSSVNVTRGTGENENVITVGIGGSPFTWREVPGDYILEYDDRENGIATTSTTGIQSITILPDTGISGEDFLTGDAVLIFQEGVAQAEIVVSSGVQLLYRSDFTPTTAGQFAILTLIKRGLDTWLLCGDMGVVS